MYKGAKINETQAWRAKNLFRMPSITVYSRKRPDTSGQFIWYWSDLVPKFAGIEVPCNPVIYQCPMRSHTAVNVSFSTSLGNSGLCWTVFARNRDTAVPAEGNGDLQTCVLVARPRRCLTLSNPVPWQNWMAAYLGYTLRMRTLFHGWPIMVNDTHTRRRMCHW